MIVGTAGFEPATPRPPAGCATRLRHVPPDDPGEPRTRRAPTGIRTLDPRLKRTLLSPLSYGGVPRRGSENPKRQEEKKGGRPLPGACWLETMGTQTMGAPPAQGKETPCSMPSFPCGGKNEERATARAALTHPRQGASPGTRDDPKQENEGDDETGETSLCLSTFRQMPTACRHYCSKCHPPEPPPSFPLQGVM